MKQAELYFYFGEGDTMDDSDKLSIYCFTYEHPEYGTDCALSEMIEDKKERVDDSVFGPYRSGGSEFYEPAVMENCDEIYSLEKAIELAKAYKAQGWEFDIKYNDIKDIKEALK